MKYSIYSCITIAMLLLSMVVLGQEDLTNDYNILHKEPVQGLKLREAWNSKIPIKSYTKVWATWNSVLLQTNEENHSIYSIKKESGIVRWINPIGFQIKKDPTENVNGFYILEKNVVYVLDPLQGGLMQKITMNHAVAGNVVASQFGLFSWEWGKKLHMLKTDANFVEGWAYKVGSELHRYATPTIHLNMAYLPTPDGILYCYDASGEKIWEFINISVFEDMEYFGRAIDNVDLKISREKILTTPDLKKIKYFKEQRDYYESQIKSTNNRKRGKFLSEPAFYKDFMYIGSTDGSLYCLNRFSGGPQWEYLNGEPVIGAIIPISDQVIFFSESAGAISIDRTAKIPLKRWAIKDATEVLNVTQKHVYFRSKGNEVICVERQYGQELWRWKIGANYEVIQDLMDDALIVIDKKVVDGQMTIYALTESGNLPKVEDKEFLPDVGYIHYNDIEKAKEAKAKDEAEKAKKLNLDKDNDKDDNKQDKKQEDKKEDKVEDQPVEE